MANNVRGREGALEEGRIDLVDGVTGNLEVDLGVGHTMSNHRPYCSTSVVEALVAEHKDRTRNLTSLDGRL